MMATSNTSFSWVESRANFFKCLKFTLRMTFLTKSFFHFKYCSHFTCIWLLSSVAAPLNITIYHFVKSFQMRSFFWSVFFCIWTEYRDLFGQFSPSVYYNNWYLIQFHPFRIFVCSYLVFSSTPQLSVTQSSMVQLLIKNRSLQKGNFSSSIILVNFVDKPCFIHHKQATVKVRVFDMSSPNSNVINNILFLGNESKTFTPLFQRYFWLNILWTSFGKWILWLYSLKTLIY